MTEPVHGRDRGRPAVRARPSKPELSIVGGTKPSATATVAISGTTPAEAELLGNYNLYNG
jgi:hypothetical protein